MTFSFDAHGNVVVSVPSTYASFGEGNTVKYFEVTADNTVLAATSGDRFGGTVWEVDSAKDPNGVPSCSMTFTPTVLVSLQDDSDFGVTANGVALPPTSITIRANFDPADPSQVFNFGFHLDGYVQTGAEIFYAIVYRCPQPAGGRLV